MSEEIVCKFPCCFRHPEKNGHCVGHQIYSDTKIEKENPKPIAKVSEKRKAEQKIYKKQVKEALSKDDRCKIKSPECTGFAQGIDHRQKRSPKNFLDTNNQVPACNACNLYKELHPVWAEANGHSISRFKKVTPLIASGEEVNGQKIIIVEKLNLKK